MKTKYAIVLILTFIMLKSNGQNGTLFPSLLPLNENGYTNQDFQNFALGQSSLSKDYQQAMVDRVKDFLREIGLNAIDENGNEPKNNEEWIRWIFSPTRTYSEDRSYSGFWNSHQSSNGQNVVFYWDKRSFHGPVLVLHYGGYELDLGKRVCANLVKTPYVLTKKQEIPKTQQPQEITTPKEDDEWLYAPTKQSSRSLVMQDEPKNYDLSLPTITTTKKVVDWVKVAKISGISLGVSTAGVLTYLLLKKGNTEGTTSSGGRITNGSHPSGGK